MKSLINLLKLFIPQFLLNKLKILKQKRDFKIWLKKGCPVPPPHIVKQNTIKEYQRKYDYKILIETGTFMGDMIEAQKSRFNKIISIELSASLYKKAVRRFKKDKHIVLVQGDSGKVLPNILSDIHESAIFWLDGHYSSGITARGNKDSPIFEELNAIFNSEKFDHILLIDDARNFIGKDDYPTIENLTEFIKSRNANYKIEVKDDIIRCMI